MLINYNSKRKLNFSVLSLFQHINHIANQGPRPEMEQFTILFNLLHQLERPHAESPPFTRPIVKPLDDIVGFVQLK